MTRVTRSIAWLIAAVLVLAGQSCASPSEKATYESFLNQIARDCNPLIIGSDNMGQALTFNGEGADPGNYNQFLGMTSAVYWGGISPEVYRSSLTAFLGSGSYNKRSFDCIFAHLPKKPANP